MNDQAWRWIQIESVLAIHDAQIAEHGGMVGVRDFSLLLSALAKPQNIYAYAGPDVADLAASYAAGIVHNHPFFDGNKRTAWIIAEVFLLKNGYELKATNQDGVTVMLDLASNVIPENKLANWYRTYIEKLSSSSGPKDR